MAMPDPYPTALLVEIGRIAATSAAVEQEIILWTSALAAQDTDGWPTDNLFTKFVTVRRRWYALAAQRFDERTLNEDLHPLNSRLAQIWSIRGDVIHGRWRVDSQDQFTVESWKQINSLELYSATYSLQELQSVGDELADILGQIIRLSRG